MKSLNDISKSYSHGPVNLALRHHRCIKQGTVWRTMDSKVIKQTVVKVKLFVDNFFRIQDLYKLQIVCLIRMWIYLLAAGDDLCKVLKAKFSFTSKNLLSIIIVSSRVI